MEMEPQEREPDMGDDSPVVSFYDHILFVYLFISAYLLLKRHFDINAFRMSECKFDVELK